MEPVTKEADPPSQGEDKQEPLAFLPITVKVGRRLPKVTLSESERSELEALIRRTKSPIAHVRRVKIALLSADDVPNKGIAITLGLTEVTLSKWRQRFFGYGTSILDDGSRSGTTWTHSDEKIAGILHLTQNTEPEGVTHWSTASMAKVAGVSQPTMSRIWRTFGLKPHLVKYFNISTDPNFTEKVRDVIGLYLNPPDAAVVFCLDEKTQIQAFDRTQPVLPMQPFVSERHTYDCKRNGTTNLYAALEMASGKMVSKTTKAHRAVEFISFLDQVNKVVAKDLDIHLIMDKYATHSTDALRAWLVENPRFQFHFSPTYSSLMFMVERWFSELTPKMLRRLTHKSEQDLLKAINPWTKTQNENPRPFHWTKTADEFFASMEKYLGPIIQGTSE